MADRHNYIALDWVTGEIEETLKQARQSLEDYVADREDATKLRFCLTYAHQVHGSLKMVELDGAAMLAAEVEALIQDLVHNQVAEEKIDHALESLMSGLLQLSAYLQRVQTTQQDQPSTLLASLNQLRLARGEEELTNAAVFNPTVESKQDQPVSKPSIDYNEFNDLVRKLRQIYQTSMVGIVRDQDVKSNFQNMLKVASRIHKVSDGTASEPLWAVIHAVLQGLDAEAKPASADVKTVLRQIDSELKALLEQGRDALEKAPKTSLLKSLLYSVAQFTNTTPLIDSIQDQYQLKSALEQSLQESDVPLPDTDAIRSVVEALNEELDEVQDILDQNTRREIGPGYELSNALPILQRVNNALSVLGAKDALTILQDQYSVIQGMVDQGQSPDADTLMDIAAHIVTIQEALTRSRSIDEARNLNVSGEQLTQAQLSVIREARNGLEQAKECVVEFVASQWNIEALSDLPKTLEQIHGGLAMVPLDRAAKVIESCKDYVRSELIEKEVVPEWQMLDMLADAMTSVEYYLECLSGETPSELDEILDVATKSVSQLGYGYNAERMANPQTVLSGDTASKGASVNSSSANSDISDNVVFPEGKPDADNKEAHLNDIDSEVVDIFIEEAAEVLSDIETSLPRWKDDLGDSQVLMDLCRSFHTLKGSGRMVGAETMSNLGWSIENMLNRLVEGHRSANQAHVDVVEQAVAAMPEIVNAFEQGRPVNNTGEINRITDQAESLANRGAVQSKPNSPAVSKVEESEQEAGLSPANEAQSLDQVSDSDQTKKDTLDVSAVGMLAAGSAAAAGAASLFGQEEPDNSMAEVDDDVVEIFIEEVGEVLDTISESMPRWQSNHQDNDALGEIRRSYHTLKGSGRMVEAKVISELAWSVENMLNRVLEGSQPAAIQHIDTVNQANKLIPSLVEAYERRVVAHTKPKAEALAQIADRIAKDDLEFDVAQEFDALVSRSSSFTVDDSVAEASVLDAISPVDGIISDTDLVREDSSQLDDSDSALLEIFDSEAHSHLDVYKGFIESASRQTDKVELTEELQRALHTLKGSAHMAEMSSIAALVTPIERLVKEMRGCHLLADNSVIDVLSEGADFLDKGLEKISESPNQPIDGADEYIARVEKLHHEQLKLIGQDPSDTTDAAQKAGALLAEGMEKILGTYDLVTGWTLMQITPNQLSGLIDDMNSLSSVAEQTEYPHVQAISQSLSEVYQKVNLEKPLSVEFFAATEEAHESLIDMMDVIAAGQRPTSPTAQLEKLQVISEQLQAQLDDSNVEFKPAPISLDPVDLSEDITATKALLPDLDNETLDIFNEEAVDLVEALDQSLSAWSKKRDEMQHLEELQRNLHTLKGGARLSGIKLLGDISHDYEAFLEQNSVKADGFFEGAIQYQSRVNAIVDTLSMPQTDKSEVEQVEQVEQPVQKVTSDSIAMHSMGQGDVSSDDSQSYEDNVTLGNLDELDPEMLEILLEEARDQQEGIEQALDNIDDDESASIDELKRVLHTLKGGARLAGVAALGNLAHNFETYLINSETNGDMQNEGFKSKLFEYQNQLAVMLDQLSGDDKSAASDSKVSDQANEAMSGELMPSGDTPAVPEVELSRAAVQATRHFVETFEKTQAQRRAPEESIKVSAALLQDLVNLAGETSISRARVEEEMSELSFSIEEMEMTIDRLKGQLRRLEIETEAQIMFRMEQVESEGAEGFDPLEMDRYSHLQQLARSLIESASDIQDVKETFSDTVRDMETLLVQQSRINTELQEGLMRSQMVPFSKMVPRLKRIVRQVAAELDKTVELQLENIEGELDRNVLERMVAPLEHMLRNAVDHGIELPQVRLKSGKSKLGKITLSVAREGAEVVIRLSDDGAGINTRAVREKAIERGLIDRDLEINDHDIIQFILHAGFSTATEVTQISGRGVGMDVVYSEIKQLGGTMEIESALGKGTTFNVRLPFTVSVNRALMVTIGHDTYAIPLNSIEGIVRVSPYELEAYYQPDAPLFEYAGQSYDLMYMGGLLDMGAKPRLEGQTMPLPVILVRGGDQSVAVQVDRLLGSREIVVKSLGPQFSMVEGLSGATVLGDGSVVVIMDLMAMIRSQSQLQAMTYTDLESGFSEAEEERNIRVMVVDDSVTVRKVTSRFLERHGMEVVLAKDGVDAMQKLQESDVIPDVMLLDIEMPRMDGFEVASRVRHSDRLSEIPIIMITSRTGAKHRDRALSLGVNHYLGKPYQESLLLEAISTLTGKLVEL